MAKITYADKVDTKVVPLPLINKVVASDMNEIKSSVNALYDLGIRVVLVTSDRDLETSDVGAVLFNPSGTQAITLTMPDPCPFVNGDKLYFATDFKSSKIQLEYNGSYFQPFSTEGISGSSEIAELAYSSLLNRLIPLCGSIVIDTTTEKSLTRNLYDKKNNHGTATLTSGTVTVNNANIRTGNEIFVTLNTPSGTVGQIYAAAADITDGTSFVINSTESGDNSTVNWKF